MTNSRQKGKAGELEASHYLTNLTGVPCRRGQQFAGGPESPDVIGLAGLHIEVKRTESLRLYDALRQSSEDARPREVPLVMHRKSKEDWVFIIRAKDAKAFAETIIARINEGRALPDAAATPQRDNHP